MEAARRQIHSPLSAAEFCFYLSILLSIALSLVPFVQLYYSAYFSDIFNIDPSVLSLSTSLLAVQLQHMTAHNLLTALDSGIYDAMILQRDVSKLRKMRKSDSLNSVLRVGLLKIPPTICQIMIILQRFRLGLAANIIVLAAVPSFYSSIWVSVLGPLCMKSQDAKSQRTNTLEESTQESLKLYTQKTYERARARLSWALILWKSLQLALASICWFTLRSHDSILLMAMMQAYRQISSLDDDCQKIAQSLPRAVEILYQMKATNGVWMHLKKGSISAFEAFWRVDELWKRWEDDGQVTTSMQIPRAEVTSIQGRGGGYGTFGQHPATYRSFADDR